MDQHSTTFSTSVNYHAPWHELQHVWLGRSYGPEFYESVANHQVRDALQTIARETEDDFQNIEQILTGMGIVVDRPVIDRNKTILDYVDTNSGRLTYQNSNSFTLLPRPPMQARDCVLTVGQKLIKTNQESDWFTEQISKLNCQSSTSSIEFDAPMATVVGDSIIVDCREDPRLYHYFKEQFPEYKIIPVFIGGHNDAVFALLRPGLLISTYHHNNYKDTLPGWTVKYIENQSWDAIPSWRQIKHSNALKWWVPDQENNSEFNEFVNTWLTHWLGFVAETVFDVNMLMINERTVLVNNYNKDMFEFFAQHSIEPIITPFRHRFFWDGGIHCITNDIYRAGIKENYVKKN